MRLLTLTLTAAVLLGGNLTARAAEPSAPLTLDVYNPGEHSLFAVSSEIISGKNDLMLIDAQFQRNDAQKLVDKIKATGKKLTTIYISQSDPDFYFGLSILHAAFPEAKIVATQATVDEIKANKDGKLAFWGPKLGENAPNSVIVPEVLKGDRLSLEGHELEIKGVMPEKTFVWIPSLKAVVGGVLVDGNNMHVWVADSQTKELRQKWLTSLDQIAALHPKIVIPGHFLPGAPQNIASVNFTRQYLQTLEAELPKAKDSAQLIAAMKTHYPQLKEEGSLELTAKVLKGEMKWPN
jgi:glyoxylase-like metal-dependent hydrolase (beta-lactamase superfamily II)